jgi:hypothetical protein
MLTIKNVVYTLAVVVVTISLWTDLQESEWVKKSPTVFSTRRSKTTTTSWTTTKNATTIDHKAALLSSSSSSLSSPLLVLPRLPPIHLNSSWVGNLWIPPPGYHLYSPSSLGQLLSNESFLFFGDSIARRTMTTLYAMLNATTNNDISVSDLTDSRIVDVNRQGKGYTEYCAQPGLSLCRPNPGNANRTIDWGGDEPGKTGCTRHLSEYFGNATTSWVTDSLRKYTIVILSTGAWDMVGGANCNLKGANATVNAAIDTLIQVPQRDNLTIVYRTWGTIGNPANDPIVQGINALIRSRIEQHEESYLRSTGRLSSITYVDWGSVILPRSSGKKRIAGDVKAHYGYEARFVFLQMLVNHLVARRQRQLDWQ